jgi:hypothetical protein
MPAPNRVTFKLDGRREDEGFVRVGDFTRFLSGVLKALRGVEGDVADPGGTVYRLRKLETGSAVVEVEAVPKRNRPDRSERVVGTFVASLRALQSGARLPVELNPHTLDAFRTLVEPLTRGSVTHITVTNGNAPFEVTPALEQQLDRLAAHDFAATGSLTGHVDALNVHEDLVFFLYPNILLGKVACYFPRELLDTVRTAVKRYATVSGRLLYRPGSVLPHRIDVEKVEVHAPPEELPTLRSLLGALAGSSGAESLNGMPDGDS